MTDHTAAMLLATNANEVIEHQLDDRARALEQELAADVIAFCGSFPWGVDDILRHAIEDRSQKRKRLAVVLQSPGGYIEVVHRIVDTFRHHYEQAMSVKWWKISEGIIRHG